MQPRDFEQNPQKQAMLNAIYHQDDAALQRLLDDGVVDVNSAIGGTGQSFLMRAVEEGTIEAMEMLLAAGANPNQSNHYGVTPLHLCAQTGLSVRMMSLLRAGAELDVQDIGGCTPLHKAVEYHRKDDVVRLLEAGADSRLVGEDFLAGQTGSDIAQAIRQNQVPPRVDVTAPLTKKDLMAKAENGLCALDAGVTWCRAEAMFQQLEAAGERLTCEDLLQEGKNGKTYLQRAVENGVGNKVLSQLVAQGEVLEPQELLRDGKVTPLMGAIIRHGVVAELFREKMWRGKSAGDMVSFYQDLPEAAQQQVPNYFALRARLSSNEQSMQTGRGR